MDRMNAQDAAFLYLDDDAHRMYIASAALFEGPPPSYDDVLDMIAGKLERAPRYRQRVRTVPLGLGRPVWVDDPHFSLRYHLRHTALPPPGSHQQLRDLVSRLMSSPLDGFRPLWELWMVEGLSGGHWALVSRGHHCMVDGVSGTELLRVLLDEEPDAPRRPAAPWRPRPEPSPARLVADGMDEFAAGAAEQVRLARDLARHPRRLVLQVGRTLRNIAGPGETGGPVPASSLNGPIGPYRVWDWARGSLSDVDIVRSRLGGTVNDVVLALVARGFRDLLLSRGETVDDGVVRCLVPVSVRAPGETGRYDNQVSGVFADLPVGIADPVARLSAVRRQMDELKDTEQAVGGEMLASLSGFAPPPLLAIATRVAARVPWRGVNTVTTNVAGPRAPLYAAGRRMLEVFPYVPIGAQVRITVSVFSYLDNLNFGVTGDADTAPDIGVLCAGISSGMGELSDAAQAA